MTQAPGTLCARLTLRDTTVYYDILFTVADAQYSVWRIDGSTEERVGVFDSEKDACDFVQKKVAC